MATGTGTRISRLRTLIDHPRTSDAERAAAQRMLDRILAGTRPVATGDRTYGARHDRPGRHAGPERIAEMIREDIALARIFTPATEPANLLPHNAVRDAPARIAYRVEAPWDASVVVTVENVPADWGWIDDGGIETCSPALQSLIAELTGIVEAYNHDGTDVDRRFFGTVRVNRARD